MNAPIAREADRGFSLPELIVTMMLLGVAMTVIVSLFVSFSSVFNRERESTDNVNQAALIMDASTKVIKAGTPLGAVTSTGSPRPAFITANDKSIELYSNVSDTSDNLAPIRVKLAVDGDKIVESRWKAQSSTEPWTFAMSGAPDSKRTLGTGVVSTRPVFTYHSLDGSPIASPVPTAKLGLISTITVSVTTKTGSGRADPVTLTNQVRLPNLPTARLGQ